MSRDGSGNASVYRFVTGHDHNKIAKVVRQGVLTNSRHLSDGRVTTLVWCTTETPADIAIGENVEDMGARKLGTLPPANGSRFAVIDFPPNTAAAMHRTETLDYVIVISGEIEMDMDESTVRLRAGDVMVQRGTNHSWNNRGSIPARVAFVLIDASPLGIGHPLSGDATVPSTRGQN